MEAPTMNRYLWLLLPLAGALLFLILPTSSTPACCPAPPLGRPVVNADQTVILIWDPATKTEHFIRQASFKSEAEDFGFLIPSPSQPDLNESGNDAFPLLGKLTEPETIKKKAPSGGIGCGCGAAAPMAAGKANRDEVRVLDEKLVAGFKAVVLEADSATALVGWLKENGYAFSKEVEAWAQPYVNAGWKITALRVAMSKHEKETQTVAASALRMSFKTDRPLFPYREPDSKTSVNALNANHRLLRIYFVADARYKGELTKEKPWTGTVAWANKINAEDRTKALGLLKLPEDTGPAEWWLTEFEDNWPFQIAPGDVYFSRDDDQSTVKRPPTVEYVSTRWPSDIMAVALVGFLFAPLLLRLVRGGRKA
jgi:hypothetical protein